MEILVLGSHGTGKSTFAKDLSKHLAKTHIIDGIARSVANNNRLKLNKDGTKETQKKVFEVNLKEVFKERIEYNYIIHASSIPRVYAYSVLSDNKDRPSIEDIELYKIVSKYLINYFFDIIFYIGIEFEIENDMVRSIDKEYQKEVDRILRDLIKNKIFFELRGNREERVKQALEYLNRN